MVRHGEMLSQESNLLLYWPHRRSERKQIIMAKTPDSGIVELQRLERTSIEVWVFGSAPIIMHRWSEKALLQMPGNPKAGASTRMAKKGLYNPEEEAESCVYRLPDGEPGFPATGFKAATIGACRFFDKPSMTEAKQLIFVEGTGPDQLVRIFSPNDPILREDAVRLSGGGSTALRYRYQYFPWWAKLTVHFIPSSISPASVVALVDAGGLGGVGEWRPSAPKSFTGTFGTYRVMTEEEKSGYGID